MNRRDFVSLLAYASAGSMSACKSVAPPTATNPLIDVHAHIFNASDLPAVRFIKIAFLELYPPQGEVQLLDVHDPDIVDRLLQLFVAIMGEDGAPTAAQEAAVLLGSASVDQTALDGSLASETAIRRTVAFLDRLDASIRSQTQALAQAGAAPEVSADEKLRRAIEQAASAGLPPGAAVLESTGPSAGIASREAVARSAFFSLSDVGRYLRWFGLFRLYRHAHVDRLASDFRRQGYEPLVLAPAIVDFSRWLGEEVRSPLADQVKVTGLIARRPTGPAIHGYVGFDPLREVYFRHGKEKVRPLDIVRSALTEHGFAGVKLYPPMGFKPTGNADGGLTFPKYVVDDIGPGLGAQLDQALDALYDLCQELDAPILTHATESFGSGPGYASRADPFYWVPVLRQRQSGDHPLRVCLAHFGRFGFRSAAFGPDTPMPQGSWEWALGDYIASAANPPVFADISYFSEVLTADSKTRGGLAATFMAYVAAFDRGLDHLMFGTDWVLTGREKNYDNYATIVAGFLRSDCGLDADQMNRILVANAERFLGLADGAGTRQRLDGFYRRNSLPLKRLTA